MKLNKFLSNSLMALALIAGLILAPGAQALAADEVVFESALDTAELFSERDMEQTADTSDATIYNVSDNQDVRITAGGVYVLRGSASEVTVYVEAGDDDKVQLVLDGRRADRKQRFPLRLCDKRR